MERKNENLQKSKKTDKMIRNLGALDDQMLTLHISNTSPQMNSSHFAVNQPKFTLRISFR